MVREFRSRPYAALRPKDEAAAGQPFLSPISFGYAKEIGSLTKRKGN
jgi:hypothetical protein